MTLQIDGSLLLAGAGNMGSALLAGWLERGLDPRASSCRIPRRRRAPRSCSAEHGIDAQASRRPRCREPPAVIVVAVKPQVMDEVFPPLARCAGKRRSCCRSPPAARIAGFERHLPQGTRRRALHAQHAGLDRPRHHGGRRPTRTSRRRSAQHCDALLRAVGEVAWVDEEGLLDAVTAVSGSGPAYVFYLAECLAEAGVKAGLRARAGQKLARWTVAGAGELLHRSDLGADVLRQNVTSPGGTTFAALQVLMADERPRQADGARRSRPPRAARASWRNSAQR